MEADEWEELRKIKIEEMKKNPPMGAMLFGDVYMFQLNMNSYTTRFSFAHPQAGYFFDDQDIISRLKQMYGYVAVHKDNSAFFAISK